MSIIEVCNLTKIYGANSYKTVALNDISFKIEKGELISIIGASGSGKSTLLNIIGCIDTLTTGIYRLYGQDVNNLKSKQLSNIRSGKISFVFQDFALLRDYTAYENIELPILYTLDKNKKVKSEIYNIMEKLGIRELANKKVKYLSGGQQQRVAIARALVTDADIILADEPTGSLDKYNGEEILNILLEINKMGKTVIIVTHDSKIADICNRVIEISDGKIMKDRFI